MSQADKGGIIADDDSRILQTDKGNEKSDTRTDGILDTHGQCVDNFLAQIGHGEQNEDQSLEQYRRQGKLPAVAQCKTHGVGKERIQSHARSQSERQFGVNGHQQGGKG